MDLNLQAIGQTFAIYAIPVLFAITLHEVAHGYVARHFGDMTAHAQGRISLNPMRHVTVEQAGHMLHHDQPEAVAKLIEEFLTD